MVDLEQDYVAELQHECAAIEAARAECWLAAAVMFARLRAQEPAVARAMALAYPWLPEAARQVRPNEQPDGLTPRKRLEIAAERCRVLPAKGGELPAGIVDLLAKLEAWLGEEDA